MLSIIISALSSARVHVAFAFYDAASVCVIRCLNEYAAAVGEYYCEDSLFHVVHNHG